MKKPRLKGRKWKGSRSSYTPLMQLADCKKSLADHLELLAIEEVARKWFALSIARFDKDIPSRKKAIGKARADLNRSRKWVKRWRSRTARKKAKRSARKAGA